jgi:hypothetical protein
MTLPARIETYQDLVDWFSTEPAPSYDLAYPVRHYIYNDVEQQTPEMVEERMTALGAPMEIDHIMEMANFEPDFFEDATYFDIANYFDTH